MVNSSCLAADADSYADLRFFSQLVLVLSSPPLSLCSAIFTLFFYLDKSPFFSFVMAIPLLPCRIERKQNTTKNTNMNLISPLK